ncbi:MAG: TetR/AcrR family transcriptional regulator [Bacteroidota bacterium]
MKRKTRNAAKTKQEIIEKSAPIFNVHGFAGTSMQMLVEATGYQMGGIYRHFGTKLDLAKEVFRYNYQVVNRKSLELDPNLTPPEKLLMIIKNYKAMVVNPRIEGGCPVLNTSVEMDDTNEELRKLAKSFMKETLDFIEGILEEGKEKGFFRSNIDIQKEALYLYASFEGAILIGKVMRTAQSFFGILDQITKYLHENIFLKETIRH